MRTANILLAALLLWCANAIAHPVAQGAMDIDINAQRLTLNATLSLEEVLVANAYGGAQALSGLAAIRAHGDYLLAHLQLSADGQGLRGHVTAVPSQTSDKLHYQLVYPLPTTPYQQLKLSQNILREFNFAPGNPWEASFITRIRHNGAISQDGVLLAHSQALTFSPNAQSDSHSPTLAAAFVQLGISHILTGYDHLLFVAALVLAASRWQYLLAVIAAFTLAHTLTLTLSALAIVRLPSSVVEPMIATSIVAVAVQNSLWPRHSQGWLRLALAFGFGLFHGLGFAGGLLEALSGMAGLPWWWALVGFSVGVEVGHVLVVAPVYVILLGLRKRLSAQRFAQLQCVGSVLVALCGVVYVWAALVSTTPMTTGVQRL